MQRNTTARQAAFIHTCATDNIADYDLSQPNAQGTRQVPVPENGGPWPYEPEDEELEYINSPDPADLDIDLMTTKEILADIHRIPIPPEYLTPVRSVRNNERPITTPTIPGPTLAPPPQPPVQQSESLVTPLPTAKPTAPPITSQPPPRLNYALVRSSGSFLGWKQVQSRKGKGKNKQTPQNTTANNKQTPNCRTLDRPHDPRLYARKSLSNAYIICPSFVYLHLLYLIPITGTPKIASSVQNLDIPER